MRNLNIGIFFILFLASIKIAKAGKEPEIKQVVPRTGVSFAINSTALSYDAVLLNSSGAPTGIPPGSYQLFNVNNKIYLDIDQSQINHFFITQFSVTVDIEISSKNQFGIANPVQNISLTIDYDTAT